MKRLLTNCYKIINRKATAERMYNFQLWLSLFGMLAFSYLEKEKDTITLSVSFCSSGLKVGS